MIPFFLGSGAPDGGVIGATAFFAFVACCTYAVDAFFRFRDWKSSKDNADSTQTAHASQHQEQTV